MRESLVHFNPRRITKLMKDVQEARLRSFFWMKFSKKNWGMNESLDEPRPILPGDCTHHPLLIHKNLLILYIVETGWIQPENTSVHLKFKPTSCHTCRDTEETKNFLQFYYPCNEESRKPVSAKFRDMAWLHHICHTFNKPRSGRRMYKEVRLMLDCKHIAYLLAIM